MIINFSNLGGGGGGSQVQVIDNLNSTSSSAALSAKQGKVLNEKKADTTAVTESINNAVSGLASTQYVDNAVSGKADTSAVTEEISAAVSGLASTQYVDNSVSGKADTSAVTESINNAVSGLASTQYVDNSVSGKADTSAVTESISNALTSYTPTSGFATINGSAITEGGNIEIQGGGGDSTALEEITELPESPVDGALYNYNGTLIKYVDGPGNWGEWFGEEANFKSDTKRTVSTNIYFYYASLPASVDGTKMCDIDYLGFKRYVFFNLTNNTLDVYENSSGTGTPSYTVNKDASAETFINVFSSSGLYLSWKEGQIQFRSNNTGVILMNMCSTSTDTAHYELLSRPTKSNFSRQLGQNSYTVIFDNDGNVVGPGTGAVSLSTKINGTDYSYLKDSTGSGFPNMYVPTSSGDTGSLLVSQGNTTPVFKTVTQALGIDFWTGTQDEYNAITTKSATTLYIIIPDE